jgi:hypothetical protein
VRVLILHRVDGMMRGVPLSEFLPGLFYDVDDDVSSYLISVRAAVEVPTAVVPANNDTIKSSTRYGGVSVNEQRDRAADKPARRNARTPRTRR